MKKLILIYLAGIFTTFLISAGVITQTDLISIKPATPKSTVSFVYYIGDVPPEISKYSRKGYVITNTEGTQSQVLVVMSKY